MANERRRISAFSGGVPWPTWYECTADIHKATDTGVRTFALRESMMDITACTHPDIESAECRAAFTAVARDAAPVRRLRLEAAAESSLKDQVTELNRPRTS